MRKYILITLLFFTSNTLFAQNVFELFGKSQEFFETMGNNKFEDAQNFFDPSVRTNVNANSLKTLWTQITGSMGDLEGVDIVKSSVNGEAFQVIVEVVFAKVSQNFMLVFNKEQKLIGLFLAPKENVAEYTLPLYSDTTSYAEKEVYIETEKYKLVGLFTYPKDAKNFPVMVLVHGSGPADMDQTIGPNKTFKDLATGLATKGVATIRYVKRTLIYKLNGAITVKDETIDDALAALALAKKQAGVNPKKVFLYGHSLGGMLAPRIASEVPDLAGYVIAAGPARSLTDIIIDQNEYFFKLNGDTTLEMKARYDEAIQKLQLTKLTSLNDIKGDSILTGLPAAYWADLNKMNQVAMAKSNTKPHIYIAQGGMDFQVGKKDFDIWVSELKSRKNVTSKFYPELDHFFITQTEMGTPELYQRMDHVYEGYIHDLATWIKSRP